MKIGERIRKVRELKGLKKDYVATKLEMTQANYSKLESEDADMPYSRLEQIAEALEVSVAEIVNFDKHAFFNNSTNTGVVNNSHNSPNSPISINDLKLFETLIATKDKVIASLETQIGLMQALYENKS